MEEAIKNGQKAHEEATAGAGSSAGAASSASTEALNAALGGLAMTGSEDYLKNVGSYVAAALDPLGIDVKIDIETPEGLKACHVSKQSSSASKEGATDDEKKKEADEEKEMPKKADEVEPEPVKKATTPSDDEEDWTVVSDKKDSEAEAANEAEGATKDQGSLYPDLPKAETASAPAAEAAEVTQPQVTHPDPRIQVRHRDFLYKQ